MSLLDCQTVNRYMSSLTEIELKPKKCITSTNAKTVLRRLQCFYTLKGTYHQLEGKLEQSFCSEMESHLQDATF